MSLDECCSCFGRVGVKLLFERDDNHLLVYLRHGSDSLCINELVSSISPHCMYSNILLRLHPEIQSIGYKLLSYFRRYRSLKSILWGNWDHGFPTYPSCHFFHCDLRLVHPASRPGHKKTISRSYSKSRLQKSPMGIELGPILWNRYIR